MTSEPLSLSSYRRQMPKTESFKAKEAYRLYAALGPDRSIPKMIEVHPKYAKRKAQLLLWSSAFGWVERAKAYDEDQSRLRQKRRQVELDKMDEEHALIGRTHVLRAIGLIQRHIEHEETTLSNAIQLLKIASELERLARGAVTQRTEGELHVGLLPKEYIVSDGWRPDDEGSERE